MSYAPRPGDTYVQSFARGLSVIQAFGPGCQRMTLTEVAKKTKLTRAGARRILLTLQTLGFMQLEGRLFSMTPKIRELGDACMPVGHGVMTSTGPAPTVFRDIDQPKAPLLNDRQINEIVESTGVRFFVPGDYDRHPLTTITDVEVRRIAKAIERRVRADIASEAAKESA